MLLTAGCRKDPPPEPVYKGCDVKITYNDPTFSVTPDGITATLGYTGAAVATLNFLTGNKPSTETQTFDNIKASAIAKRGTIVNQPLEIGEVLDAQPTRAVTGTKSTDTSYEETVTFSFNSGKVSIPFTLTSDLPFVTVKGEKKALEFGHGDVKFVSKELSAAESIEQGGQKYQKQTLTVKTTFTHPQKNASKPLPDIVLVLLTKVKDEPVTLIRTEDRNPRFTLDNGAQPAGFTSLFDRVSIWSNQTETSEEKSKHGTLTWSLAASVPEILLTTQTQFDGLAKLTASSIANGIKSGSNQKELVWTVTVEDLGAEFTAKPVFTWSETANSITSQPDQGTTKVKVNSVSVKATCGSFSLTHSATVTFKYTPAAVTLTGVELKSVNWGQPQVDIVRVGPYPTSWDLGSYVKASYTGSAVFTLKYSDNSTKETSVTNLKASSLAKFEDLVPRGTQIFVESIISASPVQPVVVSKTTVGLVYTEMIRFTFVEGEFFIEYSIANDIVTATVEGVQVPIPFGNGILEMTKLEKVFVSSTSKDGKIYGVENIYPTLLFTHPAGAFNKNSRGIIFKWLSLFGISNKKKETSIICDWRWFLFYLFYN